VWNSQIPHGKGGDYTFVPKLNAPSQVRVLKNSGHLLLQPTVFSLFHPPRLLNITTKVRCMRHRLSCSDVGCCRGQRLHSFFVNVCDNSLQPQQPQAAASGVRPTLLLHTIFKMSPTHPPAMKYLVDSAAIHLQVFALCNKKTAKCGALSTHQVPCPFSAWPVLPARRLSSPTCWPPVQSYMLAATLKRSTEIAVGEVITSVRLV
jgi:hypothetical protein